MLLRSTAIGLMLTCLLLIGRAGAAVVTFNLNPAASSLTLTGDFMDQALQPQTAGSTTTSYGGTIMADLVGNTIQFVNGSNIDANLQPTNQSPRANGDIGTAAADYGFTASIPVIGTAQGALRNFVLGANSSPLTVTANTFTPNINFIDSSGDLDFRSPVTFGRSGLSSSSGNGAITGGMLQTVGSTQTLTIPVDVTFTSSTATTNDTSLHFLGTLVATRLVPEPAAASLLGFTLFALRRRVPASR
jgi:hypothetical protein